MVQGLDRAGRGAVIHSPQGERMDEPLFGLIAADRNIFLFRAAQKPAQDWSLQFGSG
jgi:hypothetical protein